MQAIVSAANSVSLAVLMVLSSPQPWRPPVDVYLLDPDLLMKRALDLRSANDVRQATEIGRLAVRMLWHSDPTNPGLARVLAGQAIIESDAHNFDDAIALYRLALIASAGSDSLCNCERVVISCNIAHCLRGIGRLDAARREYKSVIFDVRRHFDKKEVALQLLSLSRVEAGLRNIQEAELLFSRAVECLDESLPNKLLINLAETELQFAKGNVDEAKNSVSAALQIAVDEFGPANLKTCEVLELQYRILRGNDENAAAESVLRDLRIRVGATLGGDSRWAQRLAQLEDN